MTFVPKCHFFGPHNKEIIQQDILDIFLYTFFLLFWVTNNHMDRSFLCLLVFLHKKGKKFEREMWKLASLEGYVCELCS